MRNHARPGYTLLEVLVALVILGLVLPGLAVMFTGSKKTQQSSYGMEQAAALAQFTLDSLTIVPYDSLFSGTPAKATWSSYQYWKPGAGGTEVPNFQRRWMWDTAKGVGTLQVQVAWSQGGKSHQVTLVGATRR